MRRSACTSDAARTPPSILLTVSSLRTSPCSMAPATPVRAGTLAPASPKPSGKRLSGRSYGAVRGQAGACAITSTTTRRKRLWITGGESTQHGSAAGRQPDVTPLVTLLLAPLLTLPRPDPTHMEVLLYR